MRLFLLLPLFSLILLPYNLSAQSYTSAEKAGSLTVKGDSTLHAWHATTEQLKGNLTLKDGNITQLSVAIPVGKLESGKKGLDKKMYKAMETDDHANVSFVLTESKVPEAPPEGAEGEARIVTGDLTILDKTLSVEIPVEISTGENGILTLKGSKNLNMKDYGVKPPSAMLGTIRTDPEIVVEFTWNLQKQKSNK